MFKTLITICRATYVISAPPVHVSVRLELTLKWENLIAASALKLRVLFCMTIVVFAKAAQSIKGFATYVAIDILVVLYVVGIQFP